MSSKSFSIAVLSLCMLCPGIVAAQDTGSVSYKIDGKAFEFKNAKLEYQPSIGLLSLSAERMEEVPDPSGTGDKAEIPVGVNIELPGDEKSFVGTHETSSPDTMPVYFTWYEIVGGKDKQEKEVREYLASLDSGDQKKIKMKLKIDSFGPAGSAVKGSFSGKLFDADGKLHDITDGVFAIPRKDVK